MFLPDRYIKGECPNCHSKDQYGDACEVCSTVYAPTDLINPYSTLSGAKPELRSSEHFFFRLSDPKCVAFLKQWLDAPGRLQPQVVNKAREWLDGSGEQALGDWDISRDAPYFGIPIPGCAGQVLLRVAGCADRLSRRAQELLRSAARRARSGERRSFEEFLAAPDTEQIHFIGKDIIYFHTLFWPAMLKFAGAPVQGAGPRVRARLHHRLGREDVQVARHRHQPAALSRDRHEPRVAALLHRRQAQRATSRTSTSTPRTSSRASTATSSASTSTSPAAPRTSSPASSPASCATARTPRALTAEARARCAQRVHESYETREFGKAMREIMALRRPHQPGLRCAPALGARQGSGQGGGAAGRVLARALRLQGALGAARAGAAASSPTRAAKELFGLDARVHLGRRAGAAAAQSAPTST